jgi:hypothetical protein
MNRDSPDTISAAKAVASPGPTVESVTLAELVGEMLGRWKLLAAGALAGLLLGIIYVWFFSPLYRSQGVFNLQNISFAEYKRYSPALTDRDRFLDYAARSGKFSAGELQWISGSIRGSAALNKWVHPVFTITKTDIKDVAETPKDANQFSGVEIDVATNSPDLAQKVVLVAGAYVRDFVIEGKILDLVLPNLTAFTGDVSRKEIDIITATFELNQLKRRRDDLLSVAGRYPGVARDAQRQVISTQDGGERYLSPVTQVVGVEAQIIEANSELTRLDREKERLRALVDFYDAARTGVLAAKTGDHFRVFNEAFALLQKRPDASNEAVRDAITTVRVEADLLRAFNTDYLRFAGAPSTQGQFRSILVWSPLVLGPLVGLLLAMLAVIALEWWRRNRALVLHPHH